MNTSHRSFVLRAILLLPGMLFIAGAMMVLYAIPEEKIPFVESDRALAVGDTAQALDLLTKQFDDKKENLDYLRQGFMCYFREDLEQAVQNFKLATSSDNADLRFTAYLGLSRTCMRHDKGDTQAIDYLRRALDIYPDDIEATYTKFRIYYDGGRTDDLRMAKNALFKIAEQDIAYRDIYNIWSDSLLDKTYAEIRRFDEILAAYLAEHPDSSAWWLDLAWDRFLVDSPQAAAATVGELQAANSGFSRPEIPLLLARCRLEENDSLGFQGLYWQAVEKADETGDFARLFIEAEPIFIEEDYALWEKAAVNNLEKAFFHFFWTDKNQDKLYPVNKRLVEHYVRLRHSEQNYRLLFPSTEFQSNSNSYKLISFASSTYNYDPALMFGRSRQLCLDSRGLLYMRLGQPDQNINSFPSYDPPMNQLEWAKYRDNMRMENRNEIWWYGDAPFVFEQVPRTGGYIFRALDSTGVRLGNMNAAMKTQRFRTDHLLEQEEYYVAQFMSVDRENIDVEIYQDQPAAASVAPTAAAAIYDTLWYESHRTASPVHQIPGEQVTRWVAVHTLQFPPGKSKYAIRMAVGEETWNGRGELDLKAFDTEYLQLSAIVLGIDPPDDLAPSHERCGVRFIPRPSFRFRRGEAIRVYLEYYNLKTGKENKRSYREYVDVLKFEGEKSTLGRITGNLKGLLTFGEPKDGTNVTLIFDREADTDQGPVSESFLIDTHDLAAGQYRLLIESRDNADGFWDDEAVLFEITGN